MADQYKELSAYYDEFVQKNRDYPAIARDLATIIGSDPCLLEIGIGTGLIAERLLRVNPSYQITGIDNSKSLLELAKQKLGNTVELQCQSVSHLQLDKTFDVAYSRGGAWTFVQDGTNTFLASHLLSRSEIQQSFHCVAKHLRSEGRLIISSSNAYGDNWVTLENDIVHRRITSTEQVDDALYVSLTYIFAKDEEILAQQDLRLRLLNTQEVNEIVSAAGLTEQPSGTKDYRLYLRQ